MIVRQPVQQHQQQQQQLSTSTVLPRIYFIKFAMGSTNLHEDWRPGGPYFSELVEFVRRMLQRVEDLERISAAKEAATTDAMIQRSVAIDGFFWNQGDSDA